MGFQSGSPQRLARIAHPSVMIVGGGDKHAVHFVEVEMMGFAGHRDVRFAQSALPQLVFANLRIVQVDRVIFQPSPKFRVLRLKEVRFPVAALHERIKRRFADFHQFGVAQPPTFRLLYPECRY